MKILYATDLHGDRNKYENLYRIAIQENVDVVINGGDMLPKQGDLFRQGKFISRFLEKHFRQFEEAEIFYLCMLSNDDLAIFDRLFEELCDRYKNIENIAQRKITIENFDFVGLNLVTDYPFRLKDRCRRDAKNYVIQRQLGSGLLSTPNGWRELDDWREYASSLPTIEEELEKLPRPINMKQSIYVMHMPPANLQLDECGNGEKVGSEAIYNFLKHHQPRLSLHGHIHESPDVSGVWSAELGNTLCIQPGQQKKLAYVILDLEQNSFQRYER